MLKVDDDDGVDVERNVREEKRRGEKRRECTPMKCFQLN